MTLDVNLFSFSTYVSLHLTASRADDLSSAHGGYPRSLVCASHAVTSKVARVLYAVLLVDSTHLVKSLPASSDDELILGQVGSISYSLVGT